MVLRDQGHRDRPSRLGTSGFSLTDEVPWDTVSNQANVYVISLGNLYMTPLDRVAIDDELSKRPLELDEGGYFIIYVVPETGMICAKHFTTVIDDQGLARDPKTGEVIPAKGKVERTHETLYEAATAKALCVQLFEETDPCPVTQFSHAAYLGREFVRAQQALETGSEYIQD